MVLGSIMYQTPPFPNLDYTCRGVMDPGRWTLQSITCNGKAILLSHALRSTVLIGFDHYTHFYRQAYKLYRLPP